MGEARQAQGLSHAAGRRAPGRLAARLALRFWRDERGATAIEYGLICALVFLAAVTAITTLMDNNKAMYAKIEKAIISVVK